MKYDLVKFRNTLVDQMNKHMAQAKSLQLANGKVHPDHLGVAITALTLAQAYVEIINALDGAAIK